MDHNQHRSRCLQKKTECTHDTHNTKSHKNYLKWKSRWACLCSTHVWGVLGAGAGHLADGAASKAAVVTAANEGTAAELVVAIQVAAAVVGAGLAVLACSKVLHVLREWVW